MIKKVPSTRFRSVSKNSVDIEGTWISLPKGFKGLGLRYFELLGEEPQKILQVETAAGITESKGSVKSRSIQLALEMKNKGINENSVVVLFSNNHVNQTIVVLATLFLGAIVAPLDPDFSNKECSELLKKLKPKICFCDTRPMSQIQAVLCNLKFNPLLVHFGVQSDGISFQSLFVQKHNNNFHPVSISNTGTAVAFILPTQGTTDTPKLVCLSHENIYVQTRILLEVFNYPDNVLSFFPLSWILQTVLTCASFEGGIIRILPPKSITERNTCKLIHDFGIGHAIFSTQYANKLISNAGSKDYNLSCLNCVLLSAVNQHYEIQHLKKLLPHVSFLQCYCLTETGCVAVTTLGNYSVSLDKPNAVGKLAYNLKIRVVDLDTNKILGKDNYGEIHVSGDGVMLGYLKENGATKLAIEKGFFKTGDMGMYDEEGWVFLKGRIEDLIVMQNYRLCPTELEDVILAHPFVKDVVVIGNSKEIWACVIKNTDKALNADKLLKYISERVPESNRPTKIIFMESFPRSSIGYVIKQKLRENLLRTNIDYATSLASI